MSHRQREANLQLKHSLMHDDRILSWGHEDRKGNHMKNKGSIDIQHLRRRTRDEK